jgi:hypothetical protein
MKCKNRILIYSLGPILRDALGPEREMKHGRRRKWRWRMRFKFYDNGGILMVEISVTVLSSL